MKRTIQILSTVLVIASMAIYVGCSSSSDPTPTAFELVSLNAGTKDLIGATFATQVPVGENIVAVFTTAVDPATVTASSVTLKAGTTVIESTITVDGATVTINPNLDLTGKTKYDISIEATVKSTEGTALSTFTTSFTTIGTGIGAIPQEANQVMYLPLDGTIEDKNTNTTKATKVFEQVAYTTDRFGGANKAANFRGATAAGNGDLVELSGTKFINANTTISFWFKVATSDYPSAQNKPMFGLAGKHGFFMEVGDQLNWVKFATNHKIPAPTDGSSAHCNGTSFMDPNQEMASKISDKWVQLVMTYDATTSLKIIYIDGVMVRTDDLGHNLTQEWNFSDFQLGDTDDSCSPFIPTNANFAIGYFGGKNEVIFDGQYSTATNTYKGGLDDFRIWDKALSASDVASLFNAEKP